jgi:hypothetical protein
VTLKLLSERRGLDEELLGSEVAESLVRTDSVVGSFPSLEFNIELGDRERAGVNFIELLRMSAVGSFDLAVEFG